MEYSLMQRLAAYAALHHQGSTMSDLCEQMHKYAPAITMDRSDALTALYSIKDLLEVEPDAEFKLQLHEKAKQKALRITSGLEIELTKLNTDLERALRAAHEKTMREIRAANQLLTQNAAQIKP